MASDLGDCTSFDSTQYECDFIGDPIDEPSGSIIGHGAVIVGHRLYVFGGDYAWSSDLALFCCDLIEEEWSAIPLHDQGPNFRKVCNAFVHNDNFVAWSLDGWDFRMHKLNCVTLGGWTEIANCAGVPKKKNSRAMQGAYHEGRQEAFLYDGSTLYVVDVVRDRSTEPITYGKAPHFAYLRLATGGNALILIGGGEYYRSTAYILDLITMTYSALNTTNLQLQRSLKEYCLAMIQGRVFVLGGTTSKNNVEMLTLKTRTFQSVVHTNYKFRTIESYQRHRENALKLAGDGLMGVTKGHAVAVAPDKVIIIGGHADNYEDFRFVMITPPDEEEEEDDD